ncbi:MAG TPA: ABC transporter substrate-binding protein [Aliidongia sp.]|uniref:ABC transporter substrate-binding protein n=1 Tax=Aliidongia sp. TaxID=1914230 RepID=UPI002DDD6FE3|nr:ABC transporter substrate-binding protein [Aliidongia sp.]HEV2677221.1 ABC transporter substrate-binding protein [Aliidongia sp.]
MRLQGISALLAATALASGFAMPASAETIKLGVLNDQSGVYTDLSGPGGVDAVRMAVEDAGGAINGNKIEIVSADHQNKPDIGTSIARQWYDQDHVDAIFDVPNSGVALAVQEVAREKHKIVIFSGPAASDLTGAKCSPVGVHWTYDTYGLAKGTGAAVTKSGGDSWFFLTADYAFGQALERDTAAVVTANGGKVLGEVRTPLASPDFSSFLLQAQASKAKIIGLANAGGDTITSIKQASEFGISSGGQKLAGLLVFLSDVNSLGLKTAQGLELTASFYWDLNDQTRAFSKRYFERNKKEPTMVQAGLYGAAKHYLEAVKSAGSTDADKVMAAMRANPVNDFMTKDGKVREDGKVVRDMYLFEVKKPEESKAPWDYYKLIRQIPAAEVTRPVEESACPLLKKG